MIKEGAELRREKEKSKTNRRSSSQGGRKELNNQGNFGQVENNSKGNENLPATLTLTSLGKVIWELAKGVSGLGPLQNPTHGLEVISSWKNLLQGDLTDSGSPYTQLVMEVVFPAVRISGTNTWKARELEPMLRFLESWEELLPVPVRQTILDNVVMPKLSVAIDLWDPRRETILIHLWMHLWLPWLRQKMEIFYETIRIRLESVLHAWQPDDMSVFCILSPWKTVLDAASWEHILVQFIIPKLSTVMNEFQVNPANQNLDKFYLVRTWATAIPITHMFPLLDMFFDKWHTSVVPLMMSRAFESREVVQPEQKHFGAPQQAAYNAQQASAIPDNAQQMGSTSRENEMSLKDVIEFYAQQNELLFKPKPGRMKDYNLDKLQPC
ncbi:hypothetical protein POM88_052754 [Heracleum sosnowskyi]|uniref:GCF C-terminal domain-containing protein n=1 Tax=Heracleum sosnowskyi TaxID=360622 RepID=A0AAD8GRV2_9APIA|nr:hypothetical protein POM88_052754 [Heracleum sosnowskyi]